MKVSSVAGVAGRGLGNAAELEQSGLVEPLAAAKARANLGGYRSPVGERLVDDHHVDHAAACAAGTSILEHRNNLLERCMPFERESWSDKRVGFGSTIRES